MKSNKTARSDPSVKTKRVRVTFEFDVPVNEQHDIYRIDPEGWVKTVVSDGLTQYVVNSHLLDSLRWLGQNAELQTIHQNWVKIFKSAEINTTIILQS